MSLEIFGYLASLLMGFVLGLVGGGGAILTVPILVYLFGTPPLEATAYSLFIVGATSLIGAILQIKNKNIEYRAVLALSLPGFMGVYISRAFILPSLPDIIISTRFFLLSKPTLIMIAFSSLMALASLSMIKKKSSQEVNKVMASSIAGILALVLIGFLLGVVSGFVGAGGGFLIIPTLIAFMGLGMRKAANTSLLIVAINSLIGFIGDLHGPTEIQWPFIFSVLSTAMAGLVLGLRSSQKVDEKRLKETFGYFVLIIGVLISGNQIYTLFR